MTERSEGKLYPPFEQWLSGEKAPDNDPNAILADIAENLFPHFAYNQFDIGRDPAQRLQYDTASSALTVLDNPRRRDLSENCGNCMDLVTKAYLLICQKYPILKKHLVFFNVEESEYFNEGGAHQVLVYADVVEIDRVPMVDYEKEYSSRCRLGLDGMGAILDPTFCRVVGINDVRYSLRIPVPVNKRGDTPLFPGEFGLAIPLALTRERLCVVFDVNFEERDLLIGFKEPLGALNFYRSGNSIVRELLVNDPEIFENISALRIAVRELLN